MSIITRMRKQTAVYWALASDESDGDDYDNYGRPVVTDPVEIDCRWEDVQEEYFDANGTKQVSKSVVYVDRDVDIGGILMLGTTDDITDLVDVKENDGAWEIKGFGKEPNFRATEFLRKAYL